MTTEALNTFLLRELARLGARLNQLEAWAHDFSGRAEHADCPIFGADHYASGTLTEGGDVEQAPSDSLSGPTGNAGDAQ